MMGFITCNFPSVHSIHVKLTCDSSNGSMVHKITFVVGKNPASQNHLPTEFGHITFSLLTVFYNDLRTP